MQRQFHRMDSYVVGYFAYLVYRHGKRKGSRKGYHVGLWRGRRR